MADIPCDHKSAGVLVEKSGAILLIERKKFPAGFALPAGHLDGDMYEAGARRELQEETGIEALILEHLFSEELPNPCRRIENGYHQWEVFRAKEWRGVLKPAMDETKSAEWTSAARLAALAERTETFAAKEGIVVSDLPRLTRALSENHEWQASPGFEPVWYYFLKKLRKI